MDIVKPKEVPKKVVDFKEVFTEEGEEEETGKVAKKLPGVLVIQEEEGEPYVSEKEVVETKEKEAEDKEEEEEASPDSPAEEDEREDWEIELEKERELAAAAKPAVVKGGPTKKNSRSSKPDNRSLLLAVLSIMQVNSDWPSVFPHPKNSSSKRRHIT